MRLRVLLHDRPGANSLLSQLGVKETLRYVDTAFRYSSTNLMSESALTIMRVSVEPGHAAGVHEPRCRMPPISDAPSRKGLFRWWAGDSVIKFGPRDKLFSRSRLVLEVADTDGGAHVDAGLHPDYAELSRGNALGVEVFSGGMFSDFDNKPVLPAIRQIAHELLLTLQERFPDQFGNAEVIAFAGVEGEALFRERGEAASISEKA